MFGLVFLQMLLLDHYLNLLEEIIDPLITINMENTINAASKIVFPQQEAPPPLAKQ